jgi:hypothetical protein
MKARFQRRACRTSLMAGALSTTTYWPARATVFSAYDPGDVFEKHTAQRLLTAAFPARL